MPIPLMARERTLTPSIEVRVLDGHHQNSKIINTKVFKFGDNIYYIIYQTTNKINGKVYIGKHQTKDLNDGYMGSGKLISRAITKYGTENFSKEILFTYECEELMNAKEKELVTEEFCLREDTYNLCPGGQGGFGFINRMTRRGENPEMELRRVTNMRRTHIQRGIKPPIHEWTVESRVKLGNSVKECIRKDPSRNVFINNNPMNNLEYRAKHKIACQGLSKGEKNSQFGSMWITNGTENKKIKKVDIIPEGWYKGRKM